MSVEKRHISNLPTEFDFLALSQALSEKGNIRDKVSRIMKEGLVIGVAPGIYVLAEELRKRPVSREILANMIYGPSYVSFESALSRAALIPEGVSAVTSATPKRKRETDTVLGRFSYRHLPLDAYRFGWKREELADGSGYLIAHPEKALLDSLYLAGSLRSVAALEERLYDDMRIDEAAFRGLDRGRLKEYATLMPGDTFRLHFIKMLEKRHE